MTFAENSRQFCSKYKHLHACVCVFLRPLSPLFLVVLVAVVSLCVPRDYFLNVSISK